MDQFTHNLFTFTRWDEYSYWCTQHAYTLSDLYREMDKLAQEGIPLEAMHTICREYDRSGGFRYHRLTIDFAANQQVEAFAKRLHQAWLAQKAIDDERYARQYEVALANQRAQGMGDSDIELP
jgi:hypothetical protein